MRRMKLTFKQIIYAVLAIYFVLSCYTGYVLVNRRLDKERALQVAGLRYQTLHNIADFEDDDKWNPWGEAFDDQPPKSFNPPDLNWSPNFQLDLALGDSLSKNNVSQEREYDVEIWSIASIGYYLWEHIMGGELERKLGGMINYGYKKIGPVIFRFRIGAGIVPRKMPKLTQNLILVLNGREPSRTKLAKQWLDELTQFPNLQNIALVLLGREDCDNSWLYPYMATNGGVVKFAFLVYDSPDIDDHNFYQWPLGVATYRDFPLVDSAHLPIHTQRRYTCNFLGTVYKNSSRETLISVLQNSPFKDTCFIKYRTEWLAQETSDTLNDYLHALAQSDLTLNPVGHNTECYRIYEAMAYGSVPVIEDQMTTGKCGPASGTAKGSASIYPLRLLKEHKAPVIYIKQWYELTKILEIENVLSQQEKSARRRDIIQWYENFKLNMKNKFVSAILERFFNVKR